MKTKSFALSVADRCRNILFSNWQANLNTIKADANMSKEDIHTSRVHYMFKKEKSYIWIPEDDKHNTNVIIDDRASLSISSVIPGPLSSLMKSLRKFPPRVALAGDIRLLKDDKVQAVTESLAESVLLEHDTIVNASYAVSSILNSAGASCRSRSVNLQEMLSESSKYNVYKFNIKSCSCIDVDGESHDVEEDSETPKTDLLLPFVELIIDGINRSETRRRALMLFCMEYYNATARDALMLSIDHRGFDVLAKVPETPTVVTVNRPYIWKEFRFSFKEEMHDIEAFCRALVRLEEEALQDIKSYSGLGRTFDKNMRNSSPLCSDA